MRRIHGLLSPLVALAAACASSGPPAREFGSAQEASDALVAALRHGNRDEARAILGLGADEFLASGDEVADHNAIDDFVSAYDRRNALVPGEEGITLVVGRDDWPLPIPIVEDGGSFRFDMEAGLDELLSRRIGRNELNAVQVCLAIVDAQREYAASDPDGDGLAEYARKFRSDDGQRNGLYWPVKEGEPQSPLGELVAEAAAEGYRAAPRASGAEGATESTPRPYHGYCYQILTSQGPSAAGGAYDYVMNGRMIGGFAVLAWPAEYGRSGIKTFMVNHSGVVLEKDLGELTSDVAQNIKSYDPAAGWTPVE